MKPTAICFGEVLWDVFPDQKIIGGAPLNVALRMQSLGIASFIASQVGKDDLGNDLLEFLKKHRCPTRYIQESNDLPTGQVHVQLDAGGSATYEIAQPVAWDTINTPQDLLTVVREANVFLYGSLAARSPQSRASLKKLLSIAPYKVFDVNLRPPFFEEKLLLEFMASADFIKVNDEELSTLSKMLNGPEAVLEKQVRFLAQATQTASICVTLGAEGAALLHQEQWILQKGYPTTVVDTVGAGDSFLATLLSGILLNKPLPLALSDACAMGAMVAARAGANPEISTEALEKFKATHR